MSAGNGARGAEKDAAQDSKPAGAAILGAGTTHDCRDTPGIAFALDAECPYDLHNK